MSDPDDRPPTLEEAIRIFGNNIKTEASSSESPTLPLARLHKFADELLKKIKVDKFNNTDAEILAAKNHLQIIHVKANIAAIETTFDMESNPSLSDDLQLALGSLRNKRSDVRAFAKQLLGTGYSDWESSIKRLEPEIRSQKYNDGETYTAFTCPEGKWIDYGDKGPKSTVENAIVAIRHIDADDNVYRRYDSWKRQRVRFHSTTGKQLIDDYKDENVFVRELQNAIAGRFRLSFSEQMMKDALSRLTIYNSFNSMKHQLDQFKEFWTREGKTEWQKLYDERDPVNVLVKDIYKMEDSALQLAVMRKWLMAAVLRVYTPGLKFDIIPYWWGKQGLTKTYSLAALFGSDNVLEENIFTYGSKEQAEMTYHGIICVEIADPDYEKTTGGKRFKANVTRRSFRGRFAYARMEEMQTTRITYVTVLTGNKRDILYDPTGDRRVIPGEILGEIDTDLLLRLRKHILGFIACEAERAWTKCREEMRSKNINVEEMLPWDVKVPDIMLDEVELRASAALLQAEARVDDAYEDMIDDILFWSDIKYEKRKDGVMYYILSDEIRDHLNINSGHAWNSASQRIRSVLDGKLVLGKDDYAEQVRVQISGVNNYREFEIDAKEKVQWMEAHPEISQDIRWHKPSGGINVSGTRLKGYRFDLDGKDWEQDFSIIERIRKNNFTILKKS
jgi:hypothetical protein